jgi:predicted transposase YdaD
MAEGEKAGIETGKLEIARKMKEMGDSFERIRIITGFPTETIEQL